jgi:hypothetical protein
MLTASATTNWIVNGSTKAIYMFLQDTNAGSNPIIPPSVFRVAGYTANPAVAPVGAGCEQNLTVMTVNYAGTSKPPAAQTGYMGFLPGQNMLLQMYYQSLLETFRDDSEGGAETFDQWLQRGPLYCWRFERDSKNLSTQVQTKVTYDPVGAGLAWPTGGCKLYLIAEYTRAFLIRRDADDKVIEAKGLDI